jgi:hypothetical protein
MRIEIILCDSCHKSKLNDIIVNSYLVQPRLGDEGYLIDQEYIDLCTDCFENFKLDNSHKDIFIIPNDKSE